MRRPSRPRPRRAFVVLAGSLVGLGGVIAVSAATRGCFCGGSAYGYLELVAAVLLVGAVVTFDSAWGRLLLLAVGTGALMAAVLAVVGVENVAGSVPARVGDRLRGSYPNPNYLGLAVAFVPPLAVGVAARATTRWRLLGLAAVSLSAVVLFLTYSRGALAAASVGVVVAIAVSIGGRRGLIAGVAGLLALGGAAAGVYPVLLERRAKLDFPTADPSIIDRSGWDTGVLGVVQQGGARLYNTSDSSLLLQTSSSGQGLGRDLGAATPNRTYRVIVRLGSLSGNLPVLVGLSDPFRLDRVYRYFQVTRRPKRFSVTWSPSQRTPRARFNLYPGTDPARIELSEVRLRARDETSGAVQERNLPTRLAGTTTSTNDGQLAESRYVASRGDGAREAVAAFADEPVLGLGWEQFPERTARVLPYGRLATHNEYLRFAAELGGIGILLLLIAVGSVVAGLARLPRSYVRTAAAGAAAAGAAGLFFANVLVVPLVSLPFAAAAAVACTWRPPGQEGEQTG